MTNYASKPEKRIVASADSRTLKRAQYEAFEFEVESPGRVRVINGSHANPEDHTYEVTIEGGVPVECGCKADEYGDGPCKHRTSIAIREPVLAASQGVQGKAMPDGGQAPETCQNGQDGCCGPDGDDLPCFDCYQTKNRS